jgi:hypothetical protein
MTIPPLSIAIIGLPECHEVVGSFTLDSNYEHMPSRPAHHRRSTGVQDKAEAQFAELTAR